MMAHKSHLVQLAFAAIVVVCMTGSSATASGADIDPGNQPPAGQMCPKGSYVTGFDSESNIICNEISVNGVAHPGEITGDGNTETGDNRPANRQSEQVDTGSAGEAHAVEAILADPGSSPSLPDLVITDVDPTTVVFGKSEVTFTVSGAGFSAESVIIFAGSRYSPSVNQAGTRLEVTIATRNLSIGRYPITVSNGSGMESTWKKRLEIF